MARRLLADGVLVAAGTFLGNALSYGFSFVAAHQLDHTGFGQIGALLSIFLVASIPATALQVITARRVARVDRGDPAALRVLIGPLVRWSLVVGVAEAALLAALAPAVSAALPAVSVGQVAWTAVSLLPNALIFCYLGIAQGTHRFTAFTLLFLATNGGKLVAGTAAAEICGQPGMIMAAMAAAWFGVAALCHYVLRDLIGPRHLDRRVGFLRELGTASWGLGAVLVLSLLDGLFAARYLSGDVLGQYQAGTMFTRAGYFGPQFAGILAFPRLAVPASRPTALRTATIATAAIGALAVAAALVFADPLVRIAFGSSYARSGAPGAEAFSLPAAAWLFTLAGAAQALVQLAQLDAVARRSTATGWLVLGGILVEAGLIVTMAHHSPTELIETAAGVGTVTAAAGLALAARGKYRIDAAVLDEPRTGYAPASP